MFRTHKIIFLLTLFFSIEIFSPASVLEKLAFSKKTYAQNIKIESYVMSKSRLVQFLSSNEIDKNLETNKELSEKINNESVYLVLRFKNIGNQSAWGILRCNLPRNQIKMFANIHFSKDWIDYLIPVTSLYFPAKDDSIPEVTTQWEELSAK